MMYYMMITILMVFTLLTECLQVDNNSHEFVSTYLNNYDYDAKYHNIAHHTNQSTGIMIVAYNRPHYFKQTIKSLEKNPESQTLPFYFFLEGGPRATQQENLEIINSSKIKYKKVVLRNRNFGCPKNFIDARRFMFDWCNYEKVIVIEGDVIVSPHYINLTLNLHKWAKEKYANVGIVHCWSYCFLNKKEKRKQLYVVQESQPWWSFVTYCLDKKVWNEMKSILYEYERFIDAIPDGEKFDTARSKPCFWKGFPEMKQWLRKVMTTRNPKEKHGDKFPKSVPSSYFKKIFSHPQMRHDSMNAFALWMAGYIKIQTVVNRTLHIGAMGGLSGERANSFLICEDNISLDNFVEDKSISEFVVV